MPLHRAAARRQGLRRAAYRLTIVGLVPLSIAVAGPEAATSVDASEFAGPKPGVVVILEFSPGSDMRIDRKISAITGMKTGSTQILEQLVDESSGKELLVRKYFLDASSHELSRRSVTGESILLVRTTSPKLDDVWPGTMQFAEKPGQPTVTFGNELPGKCSIASLGSRQVADEERTVLTVKCEHHASNGEQVFRFTDYATGLGVIGVTVDVWGHDGEARGGYAWRLVRVTKSN